MPPTSNITGRPTAITSVW